MDFGRTFWLEIHNDDEGIWFVIVLYLVYIILCSTVEYIIK